ncbi:RES family NAD+ phosphorylase [Undibacterium terreum]|nr:RES family NAD+ phosphorylase [Undibacterium terreum]
MAVVHYDRIPAGKDLLTTIQELAVVSESAATDIVETLGHIWYDNDSRESKYPDDDLWFVLRSTVESPLLTEWSKMENSLRNEARYLNPKVTAFMESIFGGISNAHTEDGTPVLVDAGPDTRYSTFHRARVFQSDRDMAEALQHPEKSLGSPPSGIGSGGRMNAAGLPAFYGATDAKTALAEVRPPVGSYVVVASFSVIRPLKLLDLRLLGQVQLAQSLSLFDEATLVAAQRRDFLRMLSTRMTSPVMPENQDRNYLITQVVADYLVMHAQASIDGIIYPSVQVDDDGMGERNANVVLFHKAATAINADSENVTAAVDLWEQEEDGPREYFKPKISYIQVKPLYPYQQAEFRPKPALELVKDSIEIHRVMSVEIRTDPTVVEVVSDPASIWGR